MDQPHQLATMR